MLAWFSFSPPAFIQTRVRCPKIWARFILPNCLTKLKTTARLMQVVAHPDDEDGGMLTLEARGKGASVDAVYRHPR